MRFIHIADIHLGATPDSKYPWGKLRQKEIYDTFQKVIKDCNEMKVDLLLIAGDLFHKQPLIRELKELNYMFEQLENTSVVLIAGNHDYIGARSNYMNFPWCNHVFMLEDESVDSIYLEDINTEVYGFSYHTRDILKSKVDHISPGVEERINILLTHGGDERNQPFDKKLLLKSGFDYIALGHIHKPEQFSDRMFYPGSLEPLDKNELGEHGYILGEITKTEENMHTLNSNSNIKTKFVKAAIREYVKLEVEVTPDMTNGGLVDEIRGLIQLHGDTNIYRFVLNGKRDEDIIFDSNALIALGNVIEIEDKTLPDYNFIQLRDDNINNIIGLYIDRILNQNVDEKLKEKALYLGIEALLKARE